MIKEVYGNAIELIMLHYEFIHLFENSEKFSYRGISITPDYSKQMYKLTYETVETNSINNEHTESYRNSIFFNQVSRTPEDRE